METERVDWGKPEPRSAVRAGPVAPSAHGVRRIGPVRTSEECRRDTVENRKAWDNEAVSMETARVDWGKPEPRSAVRAGPVAPSAHGVRRIGPIRTSEECRRDTVENRKAWDNEAVSMETARVDWGKPEPRSAVRAGPVAPSAHGVRRIGPIRTSEECRRDTVENRKAWDNEAVSMETARVDWGKPEPRSAVRAGPVAPSAHGVRRIGPVRTSEECRRDTVENRKAWDNEAVSMETARVDWGKPEPRGAVRAGPVAPSAHGVRRIGPVRTSEECRRDTVENRKAWDNEAVSMETARVDWGKPEPRGAVRAGPVAPSAHGVRRIGPVRTSEECRRDTVEDADRWQDGG